jgi:hypothetical protein
MRNAARHTQASTSRSAALRRAAWANASAQASSATSRDPDHASTDRHSRAWVRT